MGFLTNLFKSSEVVTLREVIGELKLQTVELKQDKIQLKEKLEIISNELKKLEMENHSKDLIISELNFKLDLANTRSNEDIYVNEKPINTKLTKTQKRVVEHFEKIKGSSFEDLMTSLEMKHTTGKKYIWDLKKKGVELLFEDEE